MKNLIISLAVMGLSICQLFSQSIAGDWEGVLNVQGTTLKVVFHIAQDDEVYISTMDSPNQGAFDIEMDETSVDGDKLTIKNSRMQIVTNANYDANSDIISGTFNQGPMKIPLELKRVVAVEKVTSTSDQPMAGDWNAKLKVMGTQLRIILHITEVDNRFATLMDSPDQGAFGLEIDTTIVDGNEITLSDKGMNMKIRGTYVPDSNIINSTFQQGPVNESLKFAREEIKKPIVNRPQEPKTFDYKVEDVEFDNGKAGNTLSGTLTIPRSGDFDKAVVLVSGSGPQDRNEELLDHKPFLVLSDYLTKNGVAVLRYDDRGVGESTGDFSTGTSMDFTEDAVAAVEYLRNRDDFEGKKIGIMGHSEGGLIAPIAASLTDLDYIVLLAGPGIDADLLLMEQSEAITRVSGADEAKIQSNQESSGKIFDFMNSNQELSTEDLKEGMRPILRQQFEKLSEEDKAEIGDLDAEIENQINSVTSPWFRYFIAFKPSKYLSKTTIPVLAVNGTLDLQVLADSNLKGIEDNLIKAGNTNFTIKKFDGLNHLFQESETGSPSEYGAIEETFNEEAMGYILEWVLNFDVK